MGAFSPSAPALPCPPSAPAAPPPPGTTPLIISAESAVGIKEGGRTGLVALVVAACFAVSLPLAPLLQVSACNRQTGLTVMAYGDACATSHRCHSCRLVHRACVWHFSLGYAFVRLFVQILVMRKTPAWQCRNMGKLQWIYDCWALLSPFKAAGTTFSMSVMYAGAAG